MVDAAMISDRIYRGYGKAAKRLGVETAVYRPSGVASPISEATAIALVKMAVTLDASFAYGRPELYGGAVHYGLLDCTGLAVGDYLVRPDSRQGSHDGATWFIAALGLHTQPVLVECNSIVNIARPSAPVASSGYYGGGVIADATSLATAWPASVMAMGRFAGDVHLPGDQPLSRMRVLLPEFGVQILPNDLITTNDPIPRRFNVSNIELTDMGWRLLAQEAFT